MFLTIITYKIGASQSPEKMAFLESFPEFYVFYFLLFIFFSFLLFHLYFNSLHIYYAILLVSEEDMFFTFVMDIITLYYVLHTPYRLQMSRS